MVLPPRFGRVEQLRHVNLNQEQQRRQRVYRQLGVQQALVLVQINYSET